KEIPFKASLHDWLSLRTRLDFIYDGRVPHGMGDGSFKREEGELSAWLIRRGKVIVETAGTKLTGVAGEWLICTANEIKQVLSDDTWLLSLRLRHDWPAGKHLFSAPMVCLLSAKDRPNLEQNAVKILEIIGDVDWGRNKESSYAFLRRVRLDH